MNSTIHLPSNKIVCAACSHEELAHAFSVKDIKDNEFEYYTCSSCGTLQLPAFSDDLFDYAYANDYYGCETRKFKWPFSLFFSASKVASALKYGKLLPKDGGKALDVGVGHGGFLKALGKFKKSARLVGNDIHKSVLLPEGIDFYQGSFLETDFKDESFDLITLFHVFEHLPHPSEVLSKLSSLLEKQGHLVISIPNVKSKQFQKHQANWFHLDPPRHIHLIPSAQLIDLCRPLGLELVQTYSSSLFYNPFSSVQSLLNNYFQPRDVLYEWLKVGGGKKSLDHRLKLWMSLAVTGATFPVFTMLDYARNEDETATVELVFRKKKA